MSNLSSKIIVDITDAHAKLALLQADFKQTEASVRSMAKEMLADSDASGERGANFVKAAADAAVLKTEINEVRTSMRGVGEEATGFAAVREGIEGLTAPIEGVTGLFKLASEAFLVGLGGEKIGETAVKFAEMAEQLSRLHEITGVSVQDLQVLKYASEVTGGSFDNMQRVLIKFGASIETAISQPTGKAATQFQLLGISQDWLKAHSDDLSAVLELVSQKLMQYAAGNNRAQIETNLFGAKIGADLIPTLDLLAKKGFAGVTKAAEESGNMLSKAAIERGKEAAESYNVLSTATTGLSNSFGLSLTPALKGTAEALTFVVEKVRWLTDHINELGGIGKYFETALIGPDLAQPESLTKPKPKPQYVPGTSANAATGAAEYGGSGEEDDEPKKPQAPPQPEKAAKEQSIELEDFRADLAEMEAAWQGTQVAMLAEAVKMWQQETQVAGLSTRETIEVRKGLADAERSLNREISREKNEIAKSDAQTEIQLGKSALAAEKDRLNEALAEHRVNAAQKAEILRNATEEQYKLSLDELERELDLVKQQPVEYQHVLNQIKLLKAQNAQDLAAIDKQYSADLKREHEAQVADYKTMVGEITSAENSLISNILTKRQSLGLDLLQLGQQVLVKEIEDDAKYYTTKLLYDQLIGGSEKQAAQGGILVHLLAEQQKTAATVQGTATRKTVESTEGTSAISQAAGWVARQLGFETEKTAAVEAGAAARATAETASGAAANALAVARGFAQIQIEAAIAAAAAFADSAALGPPGLIAAPAVAAGAYATVLGFAAGLGGGVAGLEVGAWEIPQEALYLLHPGESVVPQDFASGLRSSGALDGGAGTGGPGGDTYQITVSAIDTQTGANFIQQNAGKIVAALRGQIRNGASVPGRSS